MATPDAAPGPVSMTVTLDASMGAEGVGDVDDATHAIDCGNGQTGAELSGGGGGGGNEAETIRNLVADSAIAKEIMALQDDNAGKIEKLGGHLEKEFQEASDRITDMIRKLRRKEHDLSQRVKNIARKLNVQLDDLEDDTAKGGGGWTWAFVILLVLIGSFFGVGYTKYNAYMKTHLL